MAAEPAVIDEELCRRCKGNVRSHSEDDKQRESFRDVTCLLLSYKNVIKIDNLYGFDKLVKLQLDNNIIEKIENLGHLHSLEWLDLSFNNICEINGLETMKNLTNLSLFSNRITQIQNLDTLNKLQLLSVGNNLLANLECVMYLRSFRELQAVNFVGNPFCQEVEYRNYVLAHLKYLKYLDYRLVDEQAVTSAREQYQDELLTMEETEAQKETAAGIATEKADRSAKLLEANLGGIDKLFNELSMQGEAELSKLLSHPTMAEPLEKFREQMTEATDEYEKTILALHAQKVEERVEFGESLAQAKQASAAEAMTEIAKFAALKKQIQLTLAADGANEGASQQQVAVLRKANGDQRDPNSTGSLYDTLMDLEMAQVEAYQTTISAFEANYDGLTKRAQETLAVFFGKLRDLEAAYHERQGVAAAELLERVTANEGEGLSEEAKMMLQDKETLQNALNAAHDARVSRLDQKEDEIRTKEEKLNVAVVQRVREDEYQRNRNRVVEIWNLVHKIHKDELDRMAEVEN